MRLTAILLTVASLHVCAAGRSQKVTIHSDKIPLQKVFGLIQEQTGYSFLCDVALLEKAPPVSLNVKDASLTEALDACLKNLPFTYEIQEKFIYVKPRAESTVPVQQPADLSAPADETRGRVMDSTGVPLVGATVTVKGTSNIVQTDEKGNFLLKNLARPNVLVVSYAGYTTQEVELVKGHASVVYVLMQVSTNALDEIQITAYGKTSKRLNTGDITTITAKEIERNPVPNLLQAIQGRVPGMFVTQQMGQPGGGFQVQIRSQTVLGSTGIRLSTPLYIVDGVTYPAGENLPILPNTPLGAGNALNYLDPSLMESINVLKGPDATAIYGSRGANGVIIITTKKGMIGKSRLNINVNSGVSRYGPGPAMLNTQQYLEMRHEAFANDGKNPGPSDYDVNGVWDTTRYTNWRKFFQGRAAVTTRANASYTGGTANTSFLIGANYSDQGNVQRGIGSYRQGGVHFNITSYTNDRKLSIALLGNYSNTLNTMVPFDASGNATLAPDAPPYYLPNGKLNWAGGIIQTDNLAQLFKHSANNLVANTVLTYTPISGLDVKLSMGYSYLSAKEFRGNPSYYFNPATFTPGRTSSTVNYFSISNITVDPNVSYRHRLGRRGTFDITIGGTVQTENNESHYITGAGFLSDNLLYDPASAPIANQVTSVNSTAYRYLGFFGVAHYNWDNKYILNLNGRRDGSTRFGPGNQYGNFGSIGAAWLVSEEKWFKGLRSVADFFKLTGSFGATGNQAIPDYQYLTTYGVNANAYQGGTGLTPVTPANPGLHWSTNKTWDLGAMFGFLKGRINIEGTWYHGTTSGLLASQPLSSVTGLNTLNIFANSPINIATSGVELVLNTINVKAKDFSWETSINITIPHSKLVSFPGGPGPLKAQFGANYMIGKPVTGVVLYDYKGVDLKTGQYFFSNAKGVTGPFSSFTSSLGPDDLTRFKDLAPKVFAGMSNTVRYKQVTLAFMFSFTNRVGKSYLGQSYSIPGQVNNNLTRMALRRWKKPGDQAPVPGATTNFLSVFSSNNFTQSTGAFENAAYARLTNINIAYRFSPRLLKKAHLSAMQLYLAGQNLLTISKYGSLDPENLDARTMGPLRLYTAGINLTF